ncbi:response regulator [Clostridium sp. WILCCON 0269]|uniref:Stage 0 sporulation protein A homolog n=1 Tax=Candidatus Clostridium eludens TaxID=3381663 RepID=A0ABW8SFU8_9CLOT
MKRILLVNDCKFESIIMKDKLINIGYEVEVSNEYGASSKINKFNPDVIIVNFVMKDITGDKLIEKIKAERPNIACILSSCDKINPGAFTGKGVDDIINTPIDEEKLSEVINKAILKYQTKHGNTNFRFKKAMLFCPYCGGEFNHTNNSFAFCPYCGGEL